MELEAGIQTITAHPAFQEVRSLMIQAHDELVQDMVTGPAREAGDYAKQAGVILGLEGLESLLREIRSAAERGELQLREQAEQSRPRLEAVL